MKVLSTPLEGSQPLGTNIRGAARGSHGCQRLQTPASIKASALLP
jgi:hypothetical protein